MHKSHLLSQKTQTKPLLKASLESLDIRKKVVAIIAEAEALETATGICPGSDHISHCSVLGPVLEPKYLCNALQKMSINTQSSVATLTKMKKE